LQHTDRSQLWCFCCLLAAAEQPSTKWQLTVYACKGVCCSKASLVDALVRQRQRSPLLLLVLPACC
jgi:hypothetical protein